MTTRKKHPSAHRHAPSPCATAVARRAGALALAIALALGAGSAFAGGQLGSIDVVTRPDGRVLPVYGKDGRSFVVGTPGQEYGIRVCNTTGDRVLAVMSVDGVNVVSGETASPAQSGYVLSGHECADINGWRKSLASTAAFYFTELPDAYATRTGRPENVGVIGVAFFRERPQRIVWKDSAEESPRAPATESAAAPGRRRRRRDGREPSRTARRPRAARWPPRCPRRRRRRRSARATAARKSRTCRPRASCARARHRTRPSRSTTTAARTSLRWASCRRRRSHGR